MQEIFMASQSSSRAWISYLSSWRRWWSYKSLAFHCSRWSLSLQMKFQEKSQQQQRVKLSEIGSLPQSWKSPWVWRKGSDSKFTLKNAFKWVACGGWPDSIIICGDRIFLEVQKFFKHKRRKINIVYII